MFGLHVATFLMIASGMPSGPGAFPLGIFVAHSIISDIVISGKFILLLGVCHMFSFLLGNRPSTIASMRPGSAMPGIEVLPISFFVTILYGSPHGSILTCLHKASQLLFLLLSISILSSLCASL